ncbi:mucin-5AC isoform X1 [Glossina fuscipes]|uniref:Mucin-5AC isoform X1 n=1 Tax=Glossina fuscipes TaxID=7396 RepID=A0A8U0WDA8_9MUSC|nr:mucin-5AC isoform X1 [Glossina fuscipes]
MHIVSIVQITLPTLYLLLIVVFNLSQSASGVAPAPVVYLVPPPLPSLPQFNYAKAFNFKTNEFQTSPLSSSNNQSSSKSPEQSPGFMTRVARWFGFSNGKPQIPDSNMPAASNKQLYSYPKPQQYDANGKELCNLCNKYPWMPMFPNSVHFAQTNQWAPQAAVHGAKSTQELQQASSIVKQRAVQFHFPHPNFFHIPNNNPKNFLQKPYPSGPFLPIVTPNFNSPAVAPKFQSQSYRPSSAPYFQQLPSTEPAHFHQNVAASSEIHSNTLRPNHIFSTVTPQRDSTFEIVKSHELTEFVSSIEYPATFVHTKAIDINMVSSTTMPPNHKPDTDAYSDTSTGRYLYETLNPNLNDHVPASQIITEPGSFINDVALSADISQSTKSSPTYNGQDNAPTSPQFSSQAFMYDIDNFPAASSQNVTILQQSADPWPLESKEFFFSTTPSENVFSQEEETTTQTTITETESTESSRENIVDLIASIQTDIQRLKQDTSNALSFKTRQRETPKRLLDSPIQHVGEKEGAPRPFTKDPSSLGFRSTDINQKFSQAVINTKGGHTQPWLPYTVSSAATTSTSTYRAIEASRDFVGTSPTGLPTLIDNKLSKYSIPYATKIKPRPFESTRDSAITKDPLAGLYSHLNELHTPQESMLIGVKAQGVPFSSNTTPSPRNTKYLTKILASNLRELLQRELEVNPRNKSLPANGLSFDISKLQKNIDGWTEQEYTSLSHRPSTPTIGGRSKKIPSEYLPTTTTTTTTTTMKPQRQSKTTKEFESSPGLPISINNLEPLLQDRGSIKFHYTPIEDNHLQDTDERNVFSKNNTLTTFINSSTAKSITTTTDTLTYIRNIAAQEESRELWKKAQVTISPQTKEKVYVVTPQPRFHPRTFSEQFFTGLGSAFKSPRFVVRPTPGNASNLTKFLDTNNNKSSAKSLQQMLFGSDLFGLKGLSTYTSKQPVEIIGGNSKVITIVTPPDNLETTTSASASANIMDLTKGKRTTRKPTMSPSPR